MRQALIKYDADEYPWFTGFIIDETMIKKYAYTAEFGVYDRYSKYPILLSSGHIFNYLE